MTTALAAEAPPRAIKALRAFALFCGAIGVGGLIVAPRATWGGFLVGFAFVTGLALAGPLFLAIHNLTGARWSATLVPLAEAMTRTLPVAALLGLALLGGIPSLYAWAHPEVVLRDHLLHEKSAWLNVPGFAIRMVVVFALWIWLGNRLVGTASLGAASRIRRSALFMATFGVTFSVALVDWLQSLEPHWFSTMYGVWGLAGVGQSGLGLVMVAAVLLRRAGRLRRDDSQLDDLGRLQLAVALFWAYVVFCQFMLIWYTNNPEETPWYELRQAGGWRALGLVNLAVNWFVPFAVLMPRACRRSEAVILRVGILVLAGRLLDLMIAVAPPLSQGGPRIGLFDAGAMMGVLALWALAFLKAMQRGEPRPS